MSNKNALTIRQELGDWIEEEVKEVAVNLLTLLSIKTPVDEGAAVYNWKVSINNPDSRTRQATRKGENNRSAMVQKEAPKVERYNLGDVLWVQNNLPYIQRLNDGYSEQAPKRFVEAAVNAAVNVRLN